MDLFSPYLKYISSGNCLILSNEFRYFCRKDILLLEKIFSSEESLFHSMSFPFFFLYFDKHGHFSGFFVFLSHGGNFLDYM